MAQVVELEVSGVALDSGSKVTVGSDSTLVAPARRRRAVIFANPDESEIIWLKLAAEGAAVGEGIPVFPRSGVVIRDFGGAVSAVCTSGGKDLSRAEF